MPRASDPPPGAVTDLFIIGGGVNGVAIARDAAGRGLSVRLAEAGDLAQATSSASSKLFHGGLRYLEYLEFRLVREALREREVLLRMMPHIAQPLRFVLPVDAGLRIDDTTPVGRAMGWLPGLRGRHPAWMLRAGLFLYDHLGGRHLLGGTHGIDLRRGAEGEGLRPGLRRAWEYSDVQVDDARLVVLTAMDAAARGADILTRAQVVDARAEAGLWQVELHDGRRFGARTLVDAAGPWAGQVVHRIAHRPTRGDVRMVRGSHLVTRRLFAHDKAYVLQGGDGRIVFMLPWQEDFTLIGTTDADHRGDPAGATCSPEEQAYLLDFVNPWLRRPVQADDVIWDFAGVRPLYDDGAASASAISRDYVLEMVPGPAPCLTVFGGKLTTHRRLAEAALAQLLPVLGHEGADWTAGAPLPGGDFPWDGRPALIAQAQDEFAFLPPEAVARMVRAHGTRLWDMLAGVRDPGRDFGAGLHEVELDWMARHEWAQTGEDVLFRRSKLGLRLDAAGRAAVADWFDAAGAAMR